MSELLRTVRNITARCPYSKTCQPFNGKSYFRPIGHARSFCYRLTSGCLVFKGAEPLASDYKRAFKIAWAQRSPLHFSAIDHFLIVEEEVYLALTVPSALACARKTLAFVTSFVKCHHRIPALPLPLMVLKIPDNKSRTFLSALLPYCSGRGHISGENRLEHISQHGLAVYVYYYPSTPLRAGHQVGKFPGSFGIYSGRNISPKGFDSDIAIKQWIRLIADILIAGWFPATKFGVGNCLQIQNLAINGGFCDIDSIFPMTDVSNLDDFYGHFIFCVEQFSQSKAYSNSST